MKEKYLKFGGFSVSLTVKDIEESMHFYEALGFTVFHRDETQGLLIMNSPSCNIGLFQGMFDKNVMTFNPGWDENAGALDSYTDVRVIQRSLQACSASYKKNDRRSQLNRPLLP